MVYTQTYHIGDLVTNEDGSQGLVFYVNPDGSGGWMVALTDASTDCIWGNNSDIPGLTFQTAQVQLLSDDLNGYANTQAIRLVGSQNVFPAAWLVDFENGWYLPSAGQLIHLNAVLGLLDDRFVLYGGQTMDGRYWSSSLYDETKVWCLDAGIFESSNQGAAFHENRISPRYNYGVRAVHDFSCLTSNSWLRRTVLGG